MIRRARVTGKRNHGSLFGELLVIIVLAYIALQIASWTWRAPDSQLIDSRTERP